MRFLFVGLILVIHANYSQTFDAISFTKARRDHPRLFISSTSLSVARPNRDYNQVLKVAQEAAYKAGELMRKGSGNINILKFKSNNPRDIVTELDFTCQKIIQQTISDYFPSDSFLGEEDENINDSTDSAIDQKSGSSSSSEASISALSKALSQNNDDNKGNVEQLLWIVDPIDGTTNFQSGLPLFCVSIGVVSKLSGQIVVGVIYNPMLDEMVSAIRGEGCYINGEKLLSGVEEKSIRLYEGLVNVGFPGAKESTLRVASRAIGALATKAKGLRMIACASQVMSWVAQKKINAYISWDLNSWDICAGMLIVEESGGYISDMYGNKATIKSRDLIITCSGALPSSASTATNNSTGGNTGTERSVFLVLEAENSLHYELLKVLTENKCLNYD